MSNTSEELINKIANIYVLWNSTSTPSQTFKIDDTSAKDRLSVGEYAEAMNIIRDINKYLLENFYFWRNKQFLFLEQLFDHKIFFIFFGNTENKQTRKILLSGVLKIVQFKLLHYKKCMQNMLCNSHALTHDKTVLTKRISECIEIIDMLVHSAPEWIIYDDDLFIAYNTTCDLIDSIKNLSFVPKSSSFGCYLCSHNFDVDIGS